MHLELGDLNTLLHTATHTVTHCNTMHHAATHFNILHTMYLELGNLLFPLLFFHGFFILDNPCTRTYHFRFISGNLCTYIHIYTHIYTCIINTYSYKHTHTHTHTHIQINTHT